MLADKGVRIHGDELACKAALAAGEKRLPTDAALQVERASEQDWETEYLSPDLAVRCVSGPEQAIAHINRYGTMHSEAIVADPKLAEGAAAIERFVNDMVAEEVIPMIDEDRDELKKFAAGILERFYNPFIKHMLRSISLNSLSKWEARNYPTVRDNWFKAQRLAEREAFTFAALMTLYGPNSGFEPDDTREFVDYICANWDSADMEATIAKIVKESGIFTVDFSEVPGFIGTVAGYVRDIETLGMKDALKKFLGA